MFYQNKNVITSIEGFSAFWNQETEKTRAIFAALTDAALTQKVSEDGRSLGYLAWHITATIGDMFNLAGLKTDAVTYESPTASTIAEIRSAYDHAAVAVAAEVQRHWKNEDLRDLIPMYGEEWTKSFMLLAVIMHQAHHRGQMTVLMRQAGLKVPGLYGPSKEEWKAMGIEAMP